MVERIAVYTMINAPVHKVWNFYTEPKHITKWNNAAPDWHTPRAHNDLRTGGKFLFRMEARDGSQGFDFAGVYTEVKHNELISYEIGDGRKVKVVFSEQGDHTKITVNFEAEEINSIEMQRGGWQAILDNFKKYVEEN